LGMIQRRQQPRGVGWGNYVIAWLLTYNGADCRLWQYVYERCMVSELCRKAMELLPTIGYNLIKHKCYVEDLDDLNDAEPRFLETPQPPNSTSKPTNTTPNNSPKNSILKTKAPQSPRRLCPAFPKNHPSLLPLLHTPHLVQWAAPDRGPTDSLA
jgi:hypothetical protein